MFHLKKFPGIFIVYLFGRPREKTTLAFASTAGLNKPADLTALPVSLPRPIALLSLWCFLQQFIQERRLIKICLRASMNSSVRQTSLK
jgi:hypothetical protein